MPKTFFLGNEMKCLSILVIQVVILISFGHIFDGLTLLFVFVLFLNPCFEILRNLLMNNCFVFACYYVEVCVVFLNYVFGTYETIDLFRLIIIFEYLSSVWLLIRMIDRIVADSKYLKAYPFELRLF